MGRSFLLVLKDVTDVSGEVQLSSSTLIGILAAGPIHVHESTASVLKEGRTVSRRDLAQQSRG